MTRPRGIGVLGCAGWKCGVQGLGQELLPCRPIPRSQPLTEHRKERLAFDPTFWAPSSPYPLVPWAEVPGVSGPAPGERERCPFPDSKTGGKNCPGVPPQRAESALTQPSPTKVQRRTYTERCLHSLQAEAPSCPHLPRRLVLRTQSHNKQFSLC